MSRRPALVRLDRFQQSHVITAFPIAVALMFSEDRADSAAVIIAYWAFFSVFPLLLAFVSVHNYVGRELFHIEADTAVTAGDHELRFEFEPTGEPDPAKGHGSPGRFQLYIDSSLVGTAEIPYTTPFVFNPGAMTCGADPGSPITPDYTAPFTFTGELHTVTVDVSGNLISDDEAEMRMHLARQ